MSVLFSASCGYACMRSVTGFAKLSMAHFVYLKKFQLAYRRRVSSTTALAAFETSEQFLEYHKDHV